MPAAFAYRLPADVADVELAPLLCAGIIGYRALRRRGARMTRLLSPWTARSCSRQSGISCQSRCGHSTAVASSPFAGIHLTDIPPLNYEHELFARRRR